MRWHSAAWVGGALLVAAGCVEDAQPTFEREARRVDGGRTADVGSGDLGPEAGAGDATAPSDVRPVDATTIGPDAGCAAGARAERDCPAGGTQSRVCGPGGWQPWSRCPAACPEGPARAVEAVVDADEIVELSGLVFRDFEPRPWVAFEWVVVERPEGSAAGVVESYLDARSPRNGGPPDDPSTPGALLVADVPGHFVVELYVDGGAGRCATPFARVALNAMAPIVPRVRVTLAWWTEGDPEPADDQGTDLDLHLLHPSGSNWFVSPWDCHAQNPSPEWGPVGPDANPELLSDEFGGALPEVIVLDTPEETAPLGGGYCVGVHFFSLRELRGEAGPTHPTVRVFEHDTLVFEAVQVLEVEDQLWDVGCIDVSPDGVEVRLHDRVLSPDRP